MSSRNQADQIGLRKWEGVGIGVDGAIMVGQKVQFGFEHLFLCCIGVVVVCRIRAADGLMCVCVFVFVCLFVFASVCVF